MQITERIENGIVVLKIEGELTYKNKEVFKDHLRPILHDPSVKGLILNCEQVQMMDSSAIGQIILASQTLSHRGLKCALGGMNEKVKHLFETLMAIEKILNVFSTQAEALAYVNFDHHED